MFERRLKIFLLIVFVVGVVVLLRAMHVQLVQGAYWRERASDTMKRSTLVDTIRGRILDYRGREIAVDAACIDACVDYRAILPEPDAAWLRTTADSRLRRRMGTDYTGSPRAQRREMLKNEIEAVRADVQAMWIELARLSGQTVEEIDEIRRAIVHRVEMRRRYVWYHNYEAARRRYENREPAPWYRQWLIDDEGDAPKLDSFAIDVAEQTDAHVILRAISPEVNNYLAKNADRFPGLVLRGSTHRAYPFGEASAHLVGHLSSVSREDLQKDPYNHDDLRQYYPNDLIGRSGLEALLEPALRGTRGRIEREIGREGEIARIEPRPGLDVKTTIDIELQRELQMLFKRVRYKRSDNTIEYLEMHGAAVVIDIPTGEVRALVSYPTYDPNRFDELYATLAADEINRPLINRATMNQLEPGSTIKPVVGLAGIAAGVLNAHDTIECTGYLKIGGRTYKVGRCWTASKFGVSHPDQVPHHRLPWADPHPTGFLEYADAIERSCNVWFETVGDRLGIDGLSDWMERFGLGRPTGIGIAEARGRLPRAFKGPASLRKMTAWFSSIGQGQVLATPLQMANVAATIGRDGVWMRPKLVSESEARAIGLKSDVPDRVDLKLPPEALKAAREGMVRVVNKRAGTAWDHHVRRADVLIAGKTGTAQAARFTVPVRDAYGRLVKDDNGKVVRRFLDPSTEDHVNPEAPWYRGWGSEGKDLNHAWFIGFAPADRPQIAFAVLIEYGGSGGSVAGPLASDILEACIEHGYLSLRQMNAGQTRGSARIDRLAQP